MPRRTKREVTAEQSTQGHIFIPGTWMEDRKYRLKFPNKADRTHQSAIITPPETNQPVKAYFIADNEQGVWRGEHGNLAKTSDGTTLANEDADVTGRAVENFASHYAVLAPRISGKTQADIQEEERTQRTAEAAPPNNAERGRRLSNRDRPRG